MRTERPNNITYLKLAGEASGWEEEGGGGGGGGGEPDFADAEVSSPGPAPSDPPAAVETWTDNTDDCKSVFFLCVCLQHGVS